MGNKLAYFYISDRLSAKARLEIKVLSLNFYQYPYVSGEILIEDKYTLKLQGTINNFKNLDLNYTITSDCLESNVCAIDDNVNITGELNGEFRNILIKGKGRILDGTIVYEGTRKRKDFEDVDIALTDFNSTKLFNLFDEKAILNGKGNAYLHFDTIGKRGRKGLLTFDVQDNNFSGLSVELDSQVHINNKNYTFTMDLTTPTSTLNIMNGQYDQKLKYASALYTLDVKDFADLKPVLKFKLTGPFFSSGKIIYDKKIKVKGVSESFGGILNIVYEKKKFHFYLDDIPFNNIMERLTFAPLWDADMTGKIEYDQREKEMKTKIKLKQVKFIQEELVDIVHKELAHNLDHEVFGDSSFEATYKDKVLSSTIKIANKKNYLVLQNIKLDPVRKSIDTFIDLQIQNHNVVGQLYARHDGYTTHTLDTYLKFDGLVEKHYKLKLDGPLSNKWINMDYTLSSARLPSHICTIVDDVNITGHAYGPFKRLYIRGKGIALNGHISFDGLKVGSELRDLNFKMTDIHAKKLFTLMGEPTLPHGRATIDANFKYLSKERQKASLTYTHQNGIYEAMPLNLSSHINIDNHRYLFTADIDLNHAKINLTQGEHDSDKDLTHAFYKVDVKNLALLEPLFGHKYQGPFYAVGEIDYTPELKIRGLSKTFEGLTDFLYKDEVLYVDFKDASLKSIMNALSYPLILDAATNGSINYDFKKKLLLVNTKLNNAKFLPSDLLNTAYQKSNIDLSNEVFNNSNLKLTYKNNIILGDLLLANETGHIFLTNTNINTKDKTVDAYFDVNLQKEEFTGKVYGSLDHPEVNLNIQKLIKHEMDKQLDSIMGKENREMMESMPMGSVPKDVASEMGAGFMGMFF